MEDSSEHSSSDEVEVEGNAEVSEVAKVLVTDGEEAGYPGTVDEDGTASLVEVDEGTTSVEDEGTAALLEVDSMALELGGRGETGYPGAVGEDGTAAVDEAEDGTASLVEVDPITLEDGVGTG